MNVTGVRNIANPRIRGCENIFVLHDRVESFYVHDRKLAKRVMQHSAQFIVRLRKRIFGNATARRDESCIRILKSEDMYL